MSDIRRELKLALARQHPDRGFAERVMARLDGTDGAAQRARRGVALRWLGLAAGLLIATTAVWQTWRIEQRREGERARQQVMLALQITSAKVRLARSEVIRIGRSDPAH